MAKPMGMMSGCYFIGRAELLEWVNELLQIDYDKVEDTANGAAFCQIIDAIHPGTVPLGRVNYNAISEAEMVENYKILQDAFAKNGITQYVDVATLCKGRYMAALEMFQWIHGYYEQMGGNPEYDGAARRKQTRCKEPTARGRPNKKPAGMAKRQGGMPLAPSSKNAAVKIGGISGASEAKQQPVAAKRPVRKPVQEEPVEKKPVRAVRQEKPAPAASNQAQTKELNALKKQLEELQGEVEQATMEKEYYYEKLRKIEDFCQDNEDDEIVKKILDILYEADEERGFLPPEDEDDE